MKIQEEIKKVEEDEGYTLEKQEENEKTIICKGLRSETHRNIYYNGYLLGKQEAQKMFKDAVEIVEMKIEPRLDEFFEREIQRQEARTFIREFIKELLKVLGEENV